MKLNLITPITVRKLGDRELLSLHFRLHELASPYIRKNDIENPKFHNIVLRHKIITSEMIRRGVRYRINDALDKLAFPDIEDFVSRFSQYIPSKLQDLPKSELIRLHNQLHSVWEVVHLRDVTIQQQEQLWNWHRLVERELQNRGTEVPQNWDSLDRPLGRAMNQPGSSRTFPSGDEQGPWIFIEDIVKYIPTQTVVFENIVLIDSSKKLIWLSDVGGRQLIKVMYFRILRQFPREEWSSFKTVSLEEMSAIDVAYDLVLKKLDPLLTIQLNMQFENLCLVKPYLYFVGGMVTQGASKNDIDIMLRTGLELELEKKIFNSFTNRFPDQFKSRFTVVDDSGLSPFTSYVGVCSLDLDRSFKVQPSDKVIDGVDEEISENVEGS
jgi:hypothetical protein